MENILDKEKFDSVKELSKIQMAVADGRSELEKLKKTISEYLVFREEEVNKIINKVLKESRDALENISKNHDELSNYREELEAYANELKSGSETIVTLFQDFKKKIDQAKGDMEDHYDNIREIQKQIKIDDTKIKSERRLLEGDRKLLKDEARLIKDRREALERGFEELNRLID